MERWIFSSFLNKKDGITDWNKEYDVLTFPSLSICKSIWWTDAQVTRDINKSYSETHWARKLQ